MYPRKNFPAECSDAIFRHLRGSDLLKCALVCPQWNNLVGSTRPFTEKISLRCANRFNKVKRMKRLFRNSKRDYKRIKLEGDFSDEVHRILSMKNRKWTHINARCMKIETIQDCSKFLRIFQASAYELIVSSGNFEEKDESHVESSDLQFPNLKKLEVFGELVIHFEKLFKNCKNLESLSISIRNSCKEVPLPTLIAISNCIHSCKQLKKLRLCRDGLFNDDFLSTSSCQLSEFRLEQIGNSQSLSLQQNLNLFLKSQLGTLEDLQIDKWMGNDIMRSILSMPRLKKLVLGIDAVDITEIESWQPNLSVVDLYLKPSLFGLSAFYYGTFFKVFPKVVFLIFKLLTNDVADVIPTAYPTLRKLKLEGFLATHVPNEEFFLNLEEFNCVCTPPAAENQLFESLNGQVLGLSGLPF